MKRKGYKRFMENIQNRGPNLKVAAMYISVYGLTRKIIFHMCNTSLMFGTLQRASPKN